MSMACAHAFASNFNNVLMAQALHAQGEGDLTVYRCKYKPILGLGAQATCSIVVKDLTMYGHTFTPPVFGHGIQADALEGQEMPADICKEILSIDEEMLTPSEQDEPPSMETFVCMLQMCRKRKNLALSRRVCMRIHEHGLEAHIALENYIVPMFVECGSMVDAQQAFHRLVQPNQVSWTYLIQGYTEDGDPQYALNLFDKMQEDCVHPSRHTFFALLKACIRLKCVQSGRDIHAQIACSGLEDDSFVGSNLVDMYAKCFSLGEALEVFHRLQVRDIVSWNTLITGYAEHGLGDEALNCWEHMQAEGISPNAVTFLSSLKACTSIGAISRGQEIHMRIVSEGVERNLFVGNTLVDMYAKCAFLEDARAVFAKLQGRDVVSWNALITGYAEQLRGEEALNCLERMQIEGTPPDVVTFVSGLKACASIGVKERGQILHSEIIKGGFESEPLVLNTLLGMYAKCDSLVEAQEVFDKLSVRSVVSWNALIGGYAERGNGKEALNCLEQMQMEGLLPDADTFVYALKACGSIGAVEIGLELHAEVVKEELEIHPFLGNALLDIYTKCCLLVEAWEVFYELPVKDVVSWNTLIAGYARQGECEIVFHLFEGMKDEGMDPDGTTFLSLLNVCNHAGALGKAQKYFEAMSKEYNISRRINHYNCMIDLYGRAGQFDEIVSMLKKMPIQPNLVTWITVLGACQKWTNVEIGAEAFECALRLDEKHVGAFNLMSNIYVDARMWNSVERIEAMRVSIQHANEG